MWSAAVVLYLPTMFRADSDNDWTYRQWSDMMKDIERTAAGRETVVAEVQGTVSSGVSFFAGLTVGTSITEPTMTILTEGDRARWNVEMERNTVDCVVTSDQEAAWLLHVLARFGRYSVHKRQGPVPYAIYCRV